jgi:hypothetical protein
VTIASVIGLLTAIFKAVPAIKEWWDQLLVAYVMYAKNEIKKENREAIERALKNDDQRSIEIQLGADVAGLPSGAPGAVIVDDLPGVRK